MSRKPKQTFPQRRHTDGQEAYEKMFNSASYWGNANPNYTEILLHSHQNGYHQKNSQTINAGKGVERRESSYTVGGNVNWHSDYGEQYEGFLKIKYRATI